MLIAGLLGNVELYLDQLELTEGEKCNVQGKAPFNDANQLGLNTALSTWKGHKTEDATYGALLDIVLAVDKESIALKLCNFLDKLS